MPVEIDHFNVGVGPNFRPRGPHILIPRAMVLYILLMVGALSGSRNDGSGGGGGGGKIPQ